MKATPESPRMFESDLVDFFSRTHPAAVPAVFVPATLALLWYSLTHTDLSYVATVLLFAGGFVVWTLTEYWLHRTFFHWVPKHPQKERMHFLVHGVHHTWPRDKYRLVMPPAVGFSMFWIFLGIFVLVLGRTNVWAFHAGFSLGYMTYDLTHYYIHHFSPRTEYGRNLKKHHMLHHFKENTRRFGVSSKFWDYVFRTN